MRDKGRLRGRVWRWLRTATIVSMMSVWLTVGRRQISTDLERGVFVRDGPKTSFGGVRVGLRYGNANGVGSVEDGSVDKVWIVEDG
jgi:hypothetical protein